MDYEKNDFIKLVDSLIDFLISDGVSGIMGLDETEYIDILFNLNDLRDTIFKLNTETIKEGDSDETDYLINVSKQAKYLLKTTEKYGK